LQQKIEEQMLEVLPQIYTVFGEQLKVAYPVTTEIFRQFLAVGWTLLD
jgi:hypothetical protein